MNTNNIVDYDIDGSPIYEQKKEKMIETDYEEFYKDEQKKFDEFSKDAEKIAKSIERYLKKIDSLKSEFNILNDKVRTHYRTIHTFIYDPDCEYCDVEPEFVLKYKVIELIFDKVTKEIKTWVGYDSIEEAAIGQNVLVTTVQRLMDKEYDLADWQTYTFVEPAVMYRLLKDKERFIPIYYFDDSTRMKLNKARGMTFNKECQMNK